MTQNATDYGIHLANLGGNDLQEYTPEELEELGWEKVDNIINQMKDEG